MRRSHKFVKISNPCKIAYQCLCFPFGQLQHRYASCVSVVRSRVTMASERAITGLAVEYIFAGLLVLGLPMEHKPKELAS